MATVQIDLRDLESELSRTKANVESWAKSRTEFSSNTRDSHVQSMEDQSAKLNGLQARQAALGVAAQKVKLRVEQEEQEARALQQASLSRQEELRVCEQRAIAFKEQVATAEQECISLEDSANLDEGIKQKRLGALRKALSIYSSRLGLEFKQGTEELELVFTQIDPKEPSRPFGLAVKVHDDKSYEVTRCNPEVPALRELVIKLNQNSDFSEFIKTLRRAFQKSCF